MSDFRPGAVAFDLDGTLIDSLPGIEFSIGVAMARCGISQKKIDLRSIIGPPIRVILGKLTDAHEEELDQLEETFRQSYDSEGWSRTRVYPGTKEALAKLDEAGFRLFVVTNKPHHIATRIMEWVQIGYLFERVITRDSRLPQYRSKKEMLEELRDSCGIDGCNLLLVGDTEEDGQAAAECGTRFAHVTYGYGTISETASFPVCFQTSDLSRLSEWIQLELTHDR